MNWQQVIGDTPSWESLGLLGAELNDYEVQSPGDENLRRIRVLVNVARGRLGATDPDLVVPAQLNEFHTSLERLRTALHARFVTDDDPGLATLVEVEASTNILAAAMQGLPMPLGVVDSDAAAAIDAMRTHLDRITESAREGAADLGRRIAALSDNISKLDSEDLSGLREDVATASEQVSVWSESLRTESLEYFHHSRESADAVLDDIEDLRDQARDLLGEIGRIGLTEGYSQWEKDEARQADVWRTAAIAFGSLAAVVVAALVVVHTWIEPAESENWAIALASLTIPAAFGTVARYCSRQSAHHRRNAVLGRRIALELASLGAYIKPLRPTEQEALTIKLVSAYFGRAASDPIGDDSMDSFLDQIVAARRARNEEP